MILATLKLGWSISHNWAAVWAAQSLCYAKVGNHTRAARREGYEDRCLELEDRINSIQRALGIEECSFG